MRAAKDIIGKAVISIDRGRNLGTVRDLFVDDELRWLAGVYLGREGMLSRKALVIRREDIVVFGEDFVLSRDSDVVREAKALPETERWVRLEEVEGRQVDTPGGTRVGSIGDVLLDDEARIIGVRLSRVQLEGPIAETQMILQEAIIDSGSADGAMTIELAKAERQSQGGLLVEEVDIEKPEEE